MQRRVLALLALLVLVALAGCAHSAGRMTTTSVDDASLAAEASVSLSGDGPQFTTSERRTVRSAIRTDGALANSTRDPVDPDLPVTLDGRYYDLDHEAVGNVSGTGFGVGIDYNASDPSGDRIAYEELPEVDRVALRELLVNRYEDSPSLLEPGIDRGRSVAYTHREVNRSVLVDAQQYDVVVFEGEAFPIDVRDPSPATLTTYRYTASTVATDPRTYGADLRDEYAFTLRNLSEEERTVMDQADDDAFYPSSPSHDGFDSLVDRFRDHEPVTKDSEYHSGSWIARYDGQLYWVELDYGSFVDDEEPVGEERRSAEERSEPRTSTDEAVSVTPISTDDASDGDAAAVGV